MRILVTGGAGFIGSHLGVRLLHEGHDIVVLDNLDPFYDPEEKRSNLALLAEAARTTGRCQRFVFGDIRSLSDLAVALTPTPDVLVHLAALAGVRPSLLSPERYTDVNVTGTVRLLEAARRAGVGRVVFASSSSVYGNCPQAPFHEDLDVNSPVSPYAATKRAGELLCSTHHHLYGTGIVCLRFFTVYGPRQRPDLAIRKFGQLLLEGRPLPFYGDGSTARDYTYIDDIVEGILGAVARTAANTFDVVNLGESSVLTLSEMVVLLESTLDRKAVLDHQPLPPGDVLRTWADVRRAREVLGYAPRVSKVEGFRLFAQWLTSLQTI